jgi:hypothetical protein
MSNCLLCKNQFSFFAEATLLRKYKVSYYRCEQCGFVQTEEPYWLQEAYSQPINESDVGLVSRNLRLMQFAKAVIVTGFAPSAKFMDYGGGYGLFVRLMRDYGFDFYRYDKYCENLFAKGFNADSAGSKQYELVTAFELLEHLVDPVQTLEEILAFADNILLTTELLPEDPPHPTHWWYYGLEHGQHISFFTRRSLAVLAETLNLNFSSAGSYHLLTRKKHSPFLFRAIGNHRIMAIVNRINKRKSLLDADFASTMAAQK